MSWIVGCYSLDPSSDLFARTAALHPSAVFAVRHGHAYLAVGGDVETALGGKTEAGDPWVVAGLGVFTDHGRRRVMSVNDWSTWFASHEAEIPSIGHVALARIKAGAVHLMTDATGLRTLYVTECERGIVFSTRLYWVTRLSGAADLDVHAFGSHWTAHQQLSTRAFIKNVTRLGQGARCAISQQGVTITENPWLPSALNGKGDPRTLLSASLETDLPSGRQLSFGLSGGMDSRTLLALLQDRSDACLHVFGPPVHPDVRVATKLAEISGHPIQNISEDFPPAHEAWQIARRHATEANAIAPASAALSMRYFDKLNAQNLFVMDGGFGEIGRRQFMNRLLRTSRKPLADRSPHDLLAAIRVDRANVFTDEVQQGLHQGALRDIEETFYARPDIDSWTDEDQIDLVAVRTRLPNFFGFEQARMDGLIPNLMPFADASFLSQVFATSLRERRRGRMFRRWIRRANPDLARVALVKGLTTYPFRLGPVAAFAWTTLKGRVGRAHADQRRGDFLQLCQDEIRDLVGSGAVRHAGCYDVHRLSAIVERYYRGEHHLGITIDWWLAFEFWRQGVTGEYG